MAGQSELNQRIHLYKNAVERESMILNENSQETALRLEGMFAQNKLKAEEGIDLEAGQNALTASYLKTGGSILSSLSGMNFGGSSSSPATGEQADAAFSRSWEG